MRGKCSLFFLYWFFYPSFFFLLASSTPLQPIHIPFPILSCNYFFLSFFALFLSFCVSFVSFNHSFSSSFFLYFFLSIFLFFCLFVCLFFLSLSFFLFCNSRIYVNYISQRVSVLYQWFIFYTHAFFNCIRFYDFLSWNMKLTSFLSYVHLK